MPRDYDYERQLCNAWMLARLFLDLDEDEDAAVVFRMLNEEVRDHLLRTGQPLQDLGRGKQLELDNHGEVQELPLGADRFMAWVSYGAASLGRKAG